MPTVGPVKKKGPSPPPRIVQGEARRTRFVYAKVGPMAFLSHLDLIRALPRSFRRIGVPLYYTSGFHPKPDMMFSPALSLGVASLAEILDVKVTVDIDPEAVAAELTRVSPEGLVFKHGTLLAKEDKGVSHAINRARYAVGIPRRALEALGGEARLAAEIERVLATPEIRIVRRFDRGLAKAVDVKRFLRGLSAADPLAKHYLDDARVHGDFAAVLVDVDLTGEGGVKIAEVMEALFGKNEEGDVAIPYHAVRAELGLLPANGSAIISPANLPALRDIHKQLEEAARLNAAAAATAPPQVVPTSLS